MAQVSVSVNGRRYEISCDDGQEAHVFRLAEEIDRRVGQLVASVGQVGDARLLLLASLLLADETEEMRSELTRLRAGAGAAPAGGAESEAADAAGALSEELRGLAERIESMAERLGSERTIAEQLDPA
ncbi:MAG: cell division protein ZapA [Bacteroidota bacterium]